METTNKLKRKKGQNGRQSKYDISFRRRIAKEYAEGNNTMSQIARQYGLSHHNVSDWVDKFSSDLVIKEEAIITMAPEEKKELDVLKKQNEALKKKLEYEQMKNFALETMID